MTIRKLRLFESNSSGLVRMFYFEKDRNVKIHSNVKIIHESWGDVTNGVGLPGLPILRLDSNMVEITRDYNLYRKQFATGCI